MIKRIVIKAYNFAEASHRGQERKFIGLPYFSHPKYVARMIEDITKDPELIAAALLHDVPEDCDNVSNRDIYLLFGDRIGGLVEELTSNKPKKVSKRKYLTDRMNNMSEDALLIKLADRLHNVLFLEADGVPVEFIKKYVMETHYIMSDLIWDNEENKDLPVLYYRILDTLEWLIYRYDIIE